MNLKEYFWYWQKELPEKFCDDIIRLGNEHTLHEAETGTIQRARDEKGEVSEEDWQKHYKKRKSKIVWLSEQWIYNRIWPYLEEANKNAGWNFEWDYSESFQFTKYEGSKKQHYGWHSDSWAEPYKNDHENINMQGKIRKLSCIVSLTDPKEYEGGELEIDLRNQHDFEENQNSSIINLDFIKPKGSIIVFPSFVWHRVKPVTHGTRYSLVNWTVGWPWR